MAVAVIMDFPDGTLEQYDQVMQRMGLTGDAPAPAGALFHWVAATDTGIRVVDVWETIEQFNAFADTEIGPATQAVGVPGPPQVTVLQVHNHLAA